MILPQSPARMGAENGPSSSKPLGTRHQTLRYKQAVSDTPHSKSEVIARQLSKGEDRLASYRGAARNPYLRGVEAAWERSPPHKVRVGSRTGVELYDRAGRKERGAGAVVGAIAADNG